MKRLVIALAFSIISVNCAVAGYEIVVQPQIAPVYVTRQGAFGPVTFPNPGPPAIQPAGTLVYRPPNFSRYSSATANRRELWKTPTGAELDANILAAMTGLKDKIRADVLQVRKDALAKITTDNVGVLAIYDANYAAAKAVLDGAGDTTLAKDGRTATAYLTEFGGLLGMTAPQFATWIVAENERIGRLAVRVEDEYLRLTYSVIPAETSVSVLLSLPAQFRAFSGL